MLTQSKASPAASVVFMAVVFNGCEQPSHHLLGHFLITDLLLLIFVIMINVTASIFPHTALSHAKLISSDRVPDIKRQNIKGPSKKMVLDAQVLPDCLLGAASVLSVPRQPSEWQCPRAHVSAGGDNLKLLVPPACETWLFA